MIKKKIYICRVFFCKCYCASCSFVDLIFRISCFNSFTHLYLNMFFKICLSTCFLYFKFRQPADSVQIFIIRFLYPHSIGLLLKYQLIIFCCLLEIIFLWKSPKCISDSPFVYLKYYCNHSLKVFFPLLLDGLSLESE